MVSNLRREKKGALVFSYFKDNNIQNQHQCLTVGKDSTNRPNEDDGFPSSEQSSREAKRAMKSIFRLREKFNGQKRIKEKPPLVRKVERKARGKRIRTEGETGEAWEWQPWNIIEEEQCLEALL